jgi:hypothetical protein
MLIALILDGGGIGECCGDTCRVQRGRIGNFTLMILRLAMFGETLII